MGFIWLAFRKLLPLQRTDSYPEKYSPTHPPNPPTHPTQPNPTHPTQPNPTQPNPTQPNPTQPNATQPNPTQPNPTQPNPPTHPTHPPTEILLHTHTHPFCPRSLGLAPIRRRRFSQILASASASRWPSMPGAASKTAFTWPIRWRRIWSKSQSSPQHPIQPNH